MLTHFQLSVFQTLQVLSAEMFHSLYSCMGLFHFKIQYFAFIELHEVLVRSLNSSPVLQHIDCSLSIWYNRQSFWECTSSHHEGLGCVSQQLGTIRWSQLHACSVQVTACNNMLKAVTLKCENNCFCCQPILYLSKAL